MIAIFITVLICLTLLTTSILVIKNGIRISVNHDYKHVFKDETAFQDAKPETAVMDIKDFLKNKADPEEVEDFIQDTMNTFEDYFNQEDKKDGQKGN